MTVEVFLSLLLSFSLITSLTVEAIKKYTDNDVPLNTTVLAVALLVGCLGTGCYFMLSCTPCDTYTALYMILMGFANWLTAMVGYDKVKQTILQFKDFK